MGVVTIATSLEISDDEEDEEEDKNEELSLPPHRYTRNIQPSPWRVRRVGR